MYTDSSCITRIVRQFDLYRKGDAEHARKELAELKAENGDHTETIERQKELLSEAGETLKRYKEGLQFIAIHPHRNDFMDAYFEMQSLAKSALSGTKETE